MWNLRKKEASGYRCKKIQRRVKRGNLYTSKPSQETPKPLTYALHHGEWLSNSFILALFEIQIKITISIFQYLETENPSPCDIISRISIYEVLELLAISHRLFAALSIPINSIDPDPQHPSSSCPTCHILRLHKLPIFSSTYFSNSPSPIQQQFKRAQGESKSCEYSPLKTEAIFVST